MDDPIIETIKTYDSMADEYRQRYANYDDQFVMKPFLDLFIDSTGVKNPKILDIGTGAGFDAKYLSDHGCDVTGVDLSVELMNLAKIFSPKTTFIKTDIRNLPFENNMFDGVWSAATIIHLPKRDVPNLLSKINSILKVSGVLFITLKQGSGERFVINSGNGNLEGAKRFFSFYSKNEFEQLLNNAGFNIEKYSEDQNRNNTFMQFLCRK